MPRYSPQQIDAIESFRESPYCSMSGCFESEVVIASIVRWLAANGNDWGISLPPLNTLATEHQLQHTHWMHDDDGTSVVFPCVFMGNYMNGNIVNETFIETVHRGTDGMRLNRTALHILRPDLFPG